jgi:phage FluMu protein Com
MNLKDIGSLGLSRQTQEEIYIDPATVVESDEFNRRMPGDYRERAINRLVKLGVRFHSTCNNVYNMVKRFVTVKCPYCRRNMKMTSGTGCGETYTLHFQCPKCKATADITVPSKGVAFEKERKY